MMLIREYANIFAHSHISITHSHIRILAFIRILVSYNYARQTIRLKYQG